eukprot:TRINITY_DN1567_c0_g1_i1.p1 TRINITY_DN1567_c0_g1~~TRINITY_DN1567_c0_g1_i1.p1  ORF type:complete len:801 (-),score=266.26 TRINITY_DN1567_c0_g1_i1:33-2435(-)
MSVSNSKDKGAAGKKPESELQILEEAKKVVATQAFHMKRALDGGKLTDALKFASTMCGELRTNLLSPKNYYELYIYASDQLRYLESFLLEEHSKGKRISEFYELVQYCGNILPRLYLLITVGSVYIKTKEAPTKDVLRDLVEMCRGVQHPTRGLFIRNFLSEVTRDKLPDVGSDPNDGTINDSIDFVLQNFTEMNKLWVRMQHQGQRDRKEIERDELRLLVGKNLSRLSDLSGVDIVKYSEVVLPNVTEQIINCKDQIAQQYLMECIIHVFPDEFHLNTLDTILQTCTNLQPGVNVKNILVSLIDRLALFSTRHRDQIPEKVQVVEIFSRGLSALTESKEKDQKELSLSLEDVLAVEVALMNFSIKCYPTQVGLVDEMLSLCVKALAAKAASDDTDLSKPSTVKQIQKLLNLPLDNYKNILIILKLENYPKILNYLNYTNRKRAAVDMVRNIIDNSTQLSEVEHINQFMELIAPLVKDDTAQPDPDSVDKEEFEEEQNLVASLVHLLNNEDSDKLFMMYATIRKHFAAGGPRRLKHTLAPLVFRVLLLAQKLKQRDSAKDEEWANKGKRIFKFAHETTKGLSKAELVELPMRLYLQCASSASFCEFETIAYEFLTEAFLIYEEEISESRAQLRAIQLIIGTLRSMQCFSTENYETLITKTAQHSSRLLKKPDQCRAVALCSHLFWASDKSGGEYYKDGKRVLECLQKALKIADTCMDSSMNVHLFVEILDHYLYYFENKNESVLPKHISSFLALINTNISSMEDSAEGGSAEINAHYKNTLRHIREMKESDNPLFQDINI